MKYVSTQGGCPPISFQEAILTGLPPSGGLYVPQSIPTISKEVLKEWAGLSYPQLAEKVVRYFISEDEISSLELTDIVSDCFSSFHHPDVIPLQQVGPYNIAELFHGPTGAFKDLAFVLFARFVHHFLKKQNKKGVVVIGSLGDTGIAAINAFQSYDNITVICFYPKHSISKLQRLQTTTVRSPNVMIFQCDCGSDDFDGVCIDMLKDREFISKHNLTWVNSPNVGRIICHVIHHIYTYLKMCPSCDRQVTFYIPSGALSDSTSACLASFMGVPINIVSTVNENDFFYRCFTEKLLHRPSKIINTYSCAMDTKFPHNVERILYMLSDGNAEMISSLMSQYFTQGVAPIPQTILTKAIGRIRGMRVSQEEALLIAEQVWVKHAYKLCPHTAVGVAGATKQGVSNGDHHPLAVCLATATSSKFQEFLNRLSIPIDTDHPCVKGLEEKEEYYQEMKKGENWEGILRQTIINLK